MTNLADRNPDSVMRSHLARERTFLSWLRTSIAFMAFGVAVEKFSLFLAYVAFEAGIEEPSSSFIDAKVLALTLIILGGVIAVAGAVRTARWARCTGTVENQPSPGALVSLAGVAGIIAVMLTAHVLLTQH